MCETQARQVASFHGPLDKIIAKKCVKRERHVASFHDPLDKLITGIHSFQVTKIVNSLVKPRKL